MHACMYVYMYVHTLCMYVCMYVCMYTHIYSGSNAVDLTAEGDVLLVTPPTSPTQLRMGIDGNETDDNHSLSGRSAGSSGGGGM